MNIKIVQKVLVRYGRSYQPLKYRYHNKDREKNMSYPPTEAIPLIGDRWDMVLLGLVPLFVMS